MTAIYDGLWLREMDEKFFRNVALTEVVRILSETFQQTDRMPTPITTLAVNTGSKLVLIDTGTGGQLTHASPQTGTWLANLAAAGINPKSVDAIFYLSFSFRPHQRHSQQRRRPHFSQRRDHGPGARMGVLDGRRARTPRRKIADPSSSTLGASFRA